MYARTRVCVCAVKIQQQIFIGVENGDKWKGIQWKDLNENPSIWFYVVAIKMILYDIYPFINKEIVNRLDGFKLIACERVNEMHTDRFDRFVIGHNLISNFKFCVNIQ